MEVVEATMQPQTAVAVATVVVMVGAAMEVAITSHNIINIHSNNSGSSHHGLHRGN
ncbi:hypothetical protein A2U01_0116115, partial [Trifolium medium]|nr:hypothetical protein [Trifolium medium]